MLSESQDRDRGAGGEPPGQPDDGRASADVGKGAREGKDSPLSFVLSLVFTVTGNLYLLFGTTFFAVVSTSTGWIPLPHGGRFWFVLARWWSRLLLWSSGVLVRTEHLAPLSRDQVYVFLCNHQSLFDIPVLLATLPMPARFLAKRELFKIPVFGWSLRVGGFIPVERGGFLLAQKAGLPMVPVGIHGTLGVRPRTSYRIHPGTVVVRYGEPLPPPGSGRGGSAASIALVRTKIAELAGVEAPTEASGGEREAGGNVGSSD